MSYSPIFHLFLLPFFFLFFSITNGHGQSQEKAYALMINNFTKNIQWPSNSSSNFVIGILAYQPLAQELKVATAQRKVGNKEIVIKEITSIEDAIGCQIIFIPAFKSKTLLAAHNDFKKLPILIVTNKPGLAQQGSGINFILKDGKVQFEINATAIESHGLRVSGNLKALGILVD